MSKQPLVCIHDAQTRRKKWYYNNVELNATLFRELGEDRIKSALMAIDDELLRNAIAQQLREEWAFWARGEQLLPDGEWSNIIALAGRGWGKTRFGAQSVIEWKRQGFANVNLIGPTYNDVWGVMVEGESGILAVAPRDMRPTVNQKKGLIWPDGSVSLVLTAEEPERLRGKQHQKVWADELCAWTYPQEAWDQMKMGLRLPAPDGAPVTTPQVLITTTPKPFKLLKELINDPDSYVIRGSTSANTVNLAPTFVKDLQKKYAGTRLGRQELEAEILDDNPGALWQRSNIDALRINPFDADGNRIIPEMRRIVVAIDPAVTANADSDETGIVVAGLGTDGHGYILEDATSKEKISADKWAELAVKKYKKWDADRIVAEVNNGGDLVESVIRAKSKDVSYIAVRASRGKITRAEPVAALYEQGRVHHVGSFSTLEDQMCEFNPAMDKKSPDRMDALVWAITYLMLGENNTGVLDYYEELANEIGFEGNQREVATIDGYSYPVPKLENEPVSTEPKQKAVKSKTPKKVDKPVVVAPKVNVKKNARMMNDPASTPPPTQHHSPQVNGQNPFNRIALTEDELFDQIFGKQPDLDDEE